MSGAVAPLRGPAEGRMRRSEGAAHAEEQAAAESVERANARLNFLNEELTIAYEEAAASCDELRRENTGLRSSNERLVESVARLDLRQEDLAQVLRDISIPVIFVDAACVVRQFTPHARQLYNIRAQDVGRPLADISCRFSYATLLDDCGSVLETGEPMERTLTGEKGAAQYLLRLLPTARRDGAKGVILWAFEVSDAPNGEQLRQRLTTYLDHLACFDALTGLGNRYLLHYQMETWRLGQGTNEASVLFIDVDGFKIVNDALGHSAGDRVLSGLATVLLRHAPAASVPVRYGGDEFVIFLPGVGMTAAADIAARIHLALDEPMLVDEARPLTTVSIGVASGGRETATDLVNKADGAMYAAKRGGGGRTGLAGAPAIASRERPDGSLLRAIEERRFEIHYQPIVDAGSGAIGAFEALVRWRRSGGELIDPGRFITHAEDTGLIGKVGAYVLETAMGQFQELLAVHPDWRVSINVSPLQLADPRFVELFATLLQRFGMAAGSVWLELTESNLVNAQAVERLGALRSLGCAIALDDFGTGFSSLAYLRDLPVDVVKIHRTFVSRLDDARGVELFRTIVGLARTLGLQAVAEGCETEAQRLVIAESGCAFVQGWLVGAAVPFARLRGFGAGERWVSGG